MGIIELNDDYILKKVMKLLIVFNIVIDEIECVNVFKMNGKWYLFIDFCGLKMMIDGIIFNDIYMFGYVFDFLIGLYKLLNKIGFVLKMDFDFNDVIFIYLYFVVF